MAFGIILFFGIALLLTGHYWLALIPVALIVFGRYN